MAPSDWSLKHISSCAVWKKNQSLISSPSALTWLLSDSNDLIFGSSVQNTCCYISELSFSWCLLDAFGSLFSLPLCAVSLSYLSVFSLQLIFLCFFRRILTAHLERTGCWNVSACDWTWSRWMIPLVAALFLVMDEDVISQVELSIIIFFSATELFVLCRSTPCNLIKHNTLFSHIYFCPLLVKKTPSKNNRTTWFNFFFPENTTTWRVGSWDMSGRSKTEKD